MDDDPRIAVAEGRAAATAMVLESLIEVLVMKDVPSAGLVLDVMDETIRSVEEQRATSLSGAETLDAQRAVLESHFGWLASHPAFADEIRRRRAQQR